MTILRYHNLLFKSRSYCGGILFVAADGGIQLMQIFNLIQEERVISVSQKQ